MDLKKLSAAPWSIGPLEESSLVGGIYDKDGCTYISDYGEKRRNDAEFIVMARNAFDVMMRRGWLVQQLCPNGPWMVFGPQWSVVEKDRDTILSDSFDDPFTALVEADRWYREHVEKGRES